MNLKSMGHSNFYPCRGVEGKFSVGVPEAFPGESGTKIVFPRGSKGG